MTVESIFKSINKLFEKKRKPAPKVPAMLITIGAGSRPGLSTIQSSGNIVKRMNEMFRSISRNTKVICSVRTEIINAISRFVISKEMNKVINGFEVPLVWNYNNTNSYQHPIIQILLKRIKYSIQDESAELGKIYKEWFPEKINDIEPANYILNTSWNKPRDIVRLISSAQSSIKNTGKSCLRSIIT